MLRHCFSFLTDTRPAKQKTVGSSKIDSCLWHVYCLKTLFSCLFFKMMFPFAGEVLGGDFSKATFLCGGHVAFLFDLSVYVSENVVLHS